jgi:hypothetical protein
MKTMWMLLLECIGGTGWYKTIWMSPWVHGKVQGGELVTLSEKWKPTQPG